jgi:hypothetical protein
MGLKDMIKKPSPSDSPYTEDDFLKMIEEEVIVEWFKSDDSDEHISKTVAIMRKLKAAGKVHGYIEHVIAGTQIYPVMTS